MNDKPLDTQKLFIPAYAVPIFQQLAEEVAARLGRPITLPYVVLAYTSAVDAGHPVPLSADDMIGPELAELLTQIITNNPEQYGASTGATN